MVRPFPSLRGAQWQSVRETVDARFLALVRELEDCYYGTLPDGAWDDQGNPLPRARLADGWRHGVSHPFNAGGRVHDVQPTPGASKAMFDRLHGLIWHLHAVAVIDANEAAGRPYGDIDRVDEDRGPVRSLRGEAVAKIAALRAGGTEVTR